MHESKAQTALEYILLIGGVIMFVVVAVVLTRGNVFGTGSSEIENQTQDIGDVLSSIPASAPNIYDITETPNVGTMTIEWATNVRSTSSVAYGRDLTAGPDLGSVAGSTTPVTSHVVTITNLPSDNYDYQITSCSTAGGCNTTGTLQFTV